MIGGAVREDRSTQELPELLGPTYRLAGVLRWRHGGQDSRRVDDGEQLLKIRELTGGGPVRFRQLQGYWSRGRARGASRQRGKTVAVAGQGWGIAGWHSHGGAGRSVHRSSVVWRSEGSRALSWARCGAREAGVVFKGRRPVIAAGRSGIRIPATSPVAEPPKTTGPGCTDLCC